MHSKTSVQHLGFTLTELMIAVVIVAILAAIAYPSYSVYLSRARRADGKQVLLQAAQYMERIYTERGAYNTKSDGSTASSLSDIGIPTSLLSSPMNSTPKYYNIQPLGNVFTTNITANSYALQAVPQGTQTNDPCGILTLTSNGIKGQATGQTITDCWNR